MLTALVTSSVSPQVNKAEEPRRALDTVKHSVHRGIDTIGPDKEIFSRTVSSRSL